ncbi:MAG: hypothetical protein V5B40_00780 [Candidatus Accumulibacter meliphilus]|jgi:hypothetical protein|uniref:hypothetical protein n=1 Tax=Candidatus Accumulibacter meliphilus TaxID=2211374 RepID=UPI002FC2EA96
MSSSDQKGGHWKEKLFRNFGEYATIVIYLTLVFAAFTQYRRLVLAAHDISYTNYWIALVEAFILGKVIMIGSVLRIGRGLENMPLIFPALYKAVMFTLLVVVFTLCEHGLKGLWTGKGFGSGLLEFLGKGSHELLAGSLVILVALTPFFAIRELGRVVGTDKIWALFFRARPRQ